MAIVNGPNTLPTATIASDRTQCNPGGLRHDPRVAHVNHDSPPVSSWSAWFWLGVAVILAAVLARVAWPTAVSFAPDGSAAPAAASRAPASGPSARPPMGNASETQPGPSPPTDASAPEQARVPTHGRLTVRVVDEGALPAPVPALLVLPHTPSDEPGRPRTAPWAPGDERVVFDALPFTAAQPVILVLPREHFVQASAPALTADAPEATVDITVPEDLVRLRAHVRRRDGGALAQARVELRWPGHDLVATLDATARLDLYPGDLRAGDYLLSLRVTLLENDVATEWTAQLGNRGRLPAGDVDLGVVTLDRLPLLVSGRVIERPGARFLSEVELRAMRRLRHNGATEVWDEVEAQRLTWDGDVFTLCGEASAAPLRLHAYADGHQAMAPVPFTVGDVGIVLELQRACRLDVEVLLPDDADAALVPVRVVRVDARDTPFAGGATGHGRGGRRKVSFSALAPGAYVVQTFLPGSEPMLAASSDVVLSLTTETANATVDMRTFRAITIDLPRRSGPFYHGALFVRDGARIVQDGVPLWGDRSTLLTKAHSLDLLLLVHGHGVHELDDVTASRSFDVTTPPRIMLAVDGIPTDLGEDVAVRLGLRYTGEGGPELVLHAWGREPEVKLVPQLAGLLTLRTEAQAGGNYAVSGVAPGTYRAYLSFMRKDKGSRSVAAIAPLSFSADEIAAAAVTRVRFDAAQVRAAIDALGR